MGRRTSRDEFVLGEPEPGDRKNATFIASLFVGALTVSGAIFLILEMNRPYSGLMEIASAPIRDALAPIGR